MSYMALHIECAADEGEIIIALLADEGFDSFEETTTGITAYIQHQLFKEQEVTDLLHSRFSQPLRYSTQLLPEKNWNEEWEKNFDPVIVNSVCRIRAPFHQADNAYTYEVIIQPKMSFGTGHHATTRLMMQRMLTMDYTGKKVLDFGSGTGVLAVLAAMLKASVIDVVDNDEWAFENAQENFEMNAVTEQIGSQTTHINQAAHTPYDVILANINKNILLDYMSQLSPLLMPSGYLLLSGFFEHDAADLITSAEQHGFKFESIYTEENWAVVTLTK